MTRNKLGFIGGSYGVGRDVVYPLSEKSAISSCFSPEYLAGDPLIANPSKGSTGADVGGITSLEKIWGIVIALAARF